MLERLPPPRALLSTTGQGDMTNAGPTAHTLPDALASPTGQGDMTSSGPTAHTLPAGLTTTLACDLLSTRPASGQVDDGPAPKLPPG